MYVFLGIRCSPLVHCRRCLLCLTVHLRPDCLRDQRRPPLSAWQPLEFQRLLYCFCINLLECISPLLCNYCTDTLYCTLHPARRTNFVNDRLLLFYGLIKFHKRKYKQVNIYNSTRAPLLPEWRPPRLSTGNRRYPHLGGKNPRTHDAHTPCS